ncbi:CUB domain-containing protein 1 [Eublepharis macularius]|uniref:CUB domain-containing protein 1 n=1 Tax=Eublepharis macularius TaxID=481883 RepID=A0AA97K0X7_EUBMA|nr:CUB domain-containing protein 1 [Eublepharis macularius]
MAAHRPLALLLLLRLALAAAVTLPGAGAFTISIRSVDNLTVLIKPGPSTQAEKFCRLCTGRDCFSERKVRPGEQFNFSFECQAPEKYWVLLVEKYIDCTSRLCPFADVLLQPSGLPNLNRTFIWDVKADRKHALVLKFATWLRQVEPGDTCQDQVVYKIGSRFDASTVNIGSFCKNGSVSRVKVQGEVIMTLQLPWDSKLNTSGFKIESRDSIKRLCIIESVFLSESSATLMSANFPLGFPEDELMTWQFVVPHTLRASVFFLNHTKPNCERKEPRLEYFLPGNNNPEIYSWKGGQPINIPGSFSLSLQGCDQDDTDPGALRLLFKVDVHYPKNEENISFTVDLRSEKDMNVTFYSDVLQSGSHSQNKPTCLICRSTRHCGPNVTLSSGGSTSITILCTQKDLSSCVKMVAEKSLACWKSRVCQNRQFLLFVPKSLLRLPVPLDSFVWKLTAPEDTNIELRAPGLKLQQHIPNQQHKCSGSYSYAINGTNPGKTLGFGIYCPGGAIEKIQIRNNVTISLKTFGLRFNSTYWDQDLKLSFVPAMKEDCIFTVSPAPKSKVYLETPNWVDGLPSHMNVCWNISVPRKSTAQLQFLSDRMGVICEEGWANVYVNEQTPNADNIVLRNDQLLPRTLDMRHNFWINISNCKPARNNILSMQFTVTIAGKKSDVAIIAGGVAGVLAVLTAIGLAVCCIKKKKKKETPQAPVVGVYNTNVNTQLPAKQGVFKKGRKNNESHVYAVIDDTMVYGHLLDNLSRPANAEVGVYRPFTGPVSSRPPSPPPVSSFRKMSKLSSTEESSIPVTDNEIYTFAQRALEPLKSNGDTRVSDNGEVGMSLLGKKELENSVE